MPAFQNFMANKRAATPSFMNAEIAQTAADNDATNRANALRSGNIKGAAQMYNYGMGDRTPIADALFGPENKGAFTPPPGADVVGQGQGAFPLPPELGTLAPAEAALSEAGGAGFGALAPAEAGLSALAPTAAVDATAASLAPAAAEALSLGGAGAAGAATAAAPAAAGAAGGLGGLAMLNPYSLGLMAALSMANR